MPRLRGLELSRQDFDNADWQTVITSSSKKECHTYSLAFSEQAIQAEKDGNERREEVFFLLGSICSMILTPNSDEPFKPLFVWYGPPTTRGFIIEDLPEVQLAGLNSIVAEIEDPELQARIADVLWEKKRGTYYGLLPIAVNAYIGSAERLIQREETQILSVERLERALQLAAYSQKRQELYPQLMNLLQTSVEKRLFTLSVRITRMLLTYKENDFAELATLAKSSAQTACSSGDFPAEGALWELAADCFERIGDADQERQARKSHAETFYKIATVYGTAAIPNYPAACFHLQRAIEAYRRVGKEQERTRELHRQLLDWQKESASNMQEFRKSVDISDLFIDSMQSIKGKQLAESVFILASAAHSPSKQQLRAQIMSYIDDFPLSQMIPAVVIDEQGKRLASNEGILTDDPEKREDAIRARMYLEAPITQELFAQARVIPMVLQIQREHTVRPEDLEFLISYNGFIPPGHEMIFAKGLAAGFNGDFLTGVHLLIPQIETSLRYLLSQQGIVTSSIDSKTGRQEEYGLDTLLQNETIIEILGEDAVFDLRGLLIERFGANLRNNLCHGLLRTEHFSSLIMIYCWWLILQLVSRGSPNAIPPSDEDEATPQPHAVDGLL